MYFILIDMFIANRRKVDRLAGSGLGLQDNPENIEKTS
jgi:hypothetical protein